MQASNSSPLARSTGAPRRAARSRSRASQKGARIAASSASGEVNRSRGGRSTPVLRSQTRESKPVFGWAPPSKTLRLWDRLSQAGKAAATFHSTESS
jgi:hypothetical protein